MPAREFYSRHSWTSFVDIRSGALTLPFGSYILPLAATHGADFMLRRSGWVFFAAAALSGCAGDVGEKLKYDFGIGEAPEGYVSVSEKIMERLPEVGAAEMQRLNAEERQGEVKFFEQGEFRGKFYKQAKIYERAIPMDANAAPAPASENESRVFYGYIDYGYRMYQGPRRDSRAAAEADRATIATSETGRDMYRYKFGLAGDWNGARGERVRD